MFEFANLLNALNTFQDLREFPRSHVTPVDVGGERPDFSVVDIGYIEPGHGSKGKKCWLNTSEDIKAMYEKHHKKHCILLGRAWQSEPHTRCIYLCSTVLP